MSAAPIIYQWSGEAMVPARGFERRCDEQFVVGARYRLEIIEERSRASHGHYFAALQTTWSNLPDEMLAEYPSVEHLRKKALIRCGFANEKVIACASKAEALRAAVAINSLDDYAVVVARDAVVRIYTAKSQSLKAMDKATFQRSKDAVLAYLAEMLGTTPRELAASEAA